MGEELAKGIALSTAWATGDMELWTKLATEGIELDALDLVGELSQIIERLAEELALIEDPDCTSEIVLQQLELDAEAGPEG
jgi:hypothetical protein